MRWGIWWLAALLTAAALFTARGAEGQTAPPSPGAEAGSNDSADDAKARAQEHLDRGNRLKTAGAFREALAEFREAYLAFPSPKILYNQAEVECELGRFVDAAAHYEAFLHEFPQAESDEDTLRIDAAKEEAQTARAKIATIDPHVPSGVEVVVDAHSFGRTPLAEPVHIDPGRHRVWFHLAGGVDWNVEVSLSPGQRVQLAPDSISLRAVPVPPPRPIWRRWSSWVVVGVVILGGVAAVVAGSRSGRPTCPSGALCVGGD